MFFFLHRECWQIEPIICETSCCPSGCCSDVMCVGTRILSLNGKAHPKLKQTKQQLVLSFSRCAVCVSKLDPTWQQVPRSLWLFPDAKI